jgi:hypothetical protein
MEHQALITIVMVHVIMTAPKLHKLYLLAY